MRSLSSVTVPMRLGVALLVASVAIAALILASRDQRPADELPLARVPQSEFPRTGISIEAADAQDPHIPREEALAIAERMVCCGEVLQSVPVDLRKTDGSATAVAWAINYDTTSAPRHWFSGGGFGGLFRVGITRSEKFFVLFLDATCGEYLFSLAHEAEFEWPPPMFPQPTPYPGAQGIEGASEEDLQQVGITLLPGPTDAEPRFSAERALVYAETELEGARVREVKLATMLIQAEPRFDRLVWALSLDPAATKMSVLDGFIYPNPRPACTPDFAVVLLDADSGESLVSAAR